MLVHQGRVLKENIGTLEVSPLLRFLAKAKRVSSPLYKDSVAMHCVAPGQCNMAKKQWTGTSEVFIS